MEALYKDYNYPAVGKFYSILKGEGLKYTLKEVKDFVEAQNVAQVHKAVNKQRKKLMSIVANAPNEIFQIDLLDYTKYSKQNKGFKWILICVDVFTRKAFTAPMKDKTAPITEEAFKAIVRDVKPKVIFHDMGSEFKGAFHRFVESKNIISIENEFKNHNALGIIDRFSKTIKGMISKYMTANNTTKWVDELPRLTAIYNKTPHSAILDLKPNDAEAHAEELATLNFEKTERNVRIMGTLHKIKAGDIVRIKEEKGTFTKGYEITYSKRVYTVESVRGGEATIEGKTYPINKLMSVPIGSTDINMKSKDKADKANRIVRALRKEGLI